MEAIMETIKYVIFESLYAQKTGGQPTPQVSLTRFPPYQIKLPDVPENEKTVYYYHVDKDN